MKIIIIFILLFPQLVFAGEIRGSIFTNYHKEINYGRRILAVKKKVMVPVTENQTQKIGVKGVSFYGNNCLLRYGEKIYRVENQMIRHIVSLEELGQYPGEEIITVSKVEINSFELKMHKDSDLIRCSDMRIYILQGEYRKHILNLEELQQYYFGKRIFNVTCGVVARYKILN